MHRRLEQPVAALAVALGDVHRGVGVADQLVGAGAWRRPSTIEMPMLPRSESSLLVEHAAAGAEPRGCARPMSAAAWRCPATSSSSTANSSPPKRAAVSLGRMLVVEPLGDLDQHLVAGGVAEAVVDRLEVVEVEEDHRQPALLAPRASDRVAHPLDEQRAVGAGR